MNWVIFDFTASGARIKIEASKPITPPNLLGIARKMAYANKKYHSGWICAGVTKGFAGLKLSGSIKLKGASLFTNKRIKRKRKILEMSLKEK